MFAQKCIRCSTST